LEVQEDKIIVQNSKKENLTVEYGICVWSTGIGMQPFSETLVNKIDEQKHSRAIVVDDRLRVKGIFQGMNPYTDGVVWALGDCSVIEINKLVDKMKHIFMSSDKDKNGSISFSEFQKACTKIKLHYPQTAVHLIRLEKTFQQFDKDNKGELSYEEFGALMSDIQNKLKPMPATAQVAGKFAFLILEQEGTYIAHYLNWIYEKEKLEMAAEADISAELLAELISENKVQEKVSNASEKAESQDGIPKYIFFPPFNYKHFGSLAYIGGEAAAFDFGNGFVLGGKFLAMWLWRSVYISEQVSLETRVDILLDWIKAFLFGRDVGQK
jgi:NADH dehydrogenase